MLPHELHREALLLIIYVPTRYNRAGAVLLSEPRLNQMKTINQIIEICFYLINLLNPGFRLFLVLPDISIICIKTSALSLGFLIPVLVFFGF